MCIQPYPVKFCAFCIANFVTVHAFEHVTSRHYNMAALCVIVSFPIATQIVIDIGTIL